MADNKLSALEQFLQRIYRINVFKFGGMDFRIIVMPKQMNIHEMVEFSKKWCNDNNLRFMGVTPLFEVIKERDD